MHSMQTAQIKKKVKLLIPSVVVLLQPSAIRQENNFSNEQPEI
jgi:hypothetical protein